MAHKNLISSRINHFGQESGYLPNVSKNIHQINDPIESTQQEDTDDQFLPSVYRKQSESSEIQIQRS